MNIINKTIYCKDNLDILRGVDSNTVDMIYLDPPFNKKKSFHAPIGSAAEGASFKDVFGSDDIDPRWMEEWKFEQPELYSFIKNMFFFADLSDASYIQYMAVRIIECKRILKETGSIFYHCDDTMQHYIKLMMDIIFDRGNFRNEINWRRCSNHDDGKRFGRVTDAILYYTKSDQFKWKDVYVPKPNPEKYYNLLEEETGRRFTHADMKAKGKNKTLLYDGVEYYSDKGFRWTQSTLEERLRINPHCLYVTSGGKLRMKLYADEDKGLQVQDAWNDMMTKTMTKSEDKGYPTQKPLSLLRRVIECSTDEGDMILDPFAGCATACVAAESINRRWIGIDVSEKAYELVKDRLKTEVPESLFSPVPVNFSTVAPTRNQVDDRKSKWVYVISNDAFDGEYKVGIATNWKSRLNSYQTSDPNRAYKILYKIYTKDYLEIEKAVHDHFDNRHEWVQADLNDIIEYIEKY